MTVFRSIHNKNYTTINNTIIRDKTLSWKAKGIWLYAFSRPDDWTFRFSDIVNQSTDGKDGVRAALRELERAGYLKLNTHRKDESGKWMSPEYIFYETPQSNKNEPFKQIKEINPQTEKPQAEKPQAENPPLLSTDILNTDYNNDDDDNAHAREEKIIFKDSKNEDSGNLEYETPSGKKCFITQSDIYKHFLKLPYETVIIKQAIAKAREPTGPISNILKYLERIAENILTQTKKEFDKKEDKKIFVKKEKNKSVDKKSIYPPKCTAPGVPFPYEKLKEIWAEQKKQEIEKYKNQGVKR